ncbi:hypothetical protein [Streptomyces candidus]|uniref:Mycothiol-dependent maleylpyruvate isomerase metal-binding domain-containing protein n=1 Tax=Streptomyces candidus TaxID=67283 RepID=A0A7X0HHR1_9ACTN|nr:hypothetical protein [Streptomyces candidus]MBB6437871.1 hypothetical protein [Streptomyces candidus]
MTVTPDDIRRSVGLASAVLRQTAGNDWGVKAGGLDWDCWETAEHLVDDLFSYAAQLASGRTDADVPLRYTQEAPGSPCNAVRVARKAGVEGLLTVLESAGGLLYAVAAAAPPRVRAHHVFGVSDPEGFVAMGVVETLVHTHDLATGLGIGEAWQPPAELCARALARLFPDVAAGPPPWPALLWATGRGELSGVARRDTWRWYGEPR